MRGWTPETLAPGCFSVVMATGIVGIGAAQRGFDSLARLLVAAASFAYAVLVVVSVWRLVAYRSAVLTDLRHSQSSFGFFTFVAGTDVLAACAATAGHTTSSLALLAVASSAWFVLGYAVPWLLLFAPRRAPLLASANGSWFLWVVASQSIAVVAATLQPVIGAAQSILAVLAVLAWSIGLVLYLAVAVFVSLRLLLYDVSPENLDPAYWVAMGAIAITVVAGAKILEMTQAPMVTATHGLIAGLAVVLWLFASWLIPALTALTVWRYVVRGLPLRQEESLWSIVFPLGMYAVAGMYLGRADVLPFVEHLGQLWFWVGLTAWTLALALRGLALAHALRRR